MSAIKQHCSTVSGLVIVATLLTAPRSEGADYDALPAPTVLRTNLSHYSLWLSLDTNGRNDGVVTPVQVRNQHYYVQNSVLKSHFIHTGSDKQWIDVNTLPQVTVRYDSLHQVLVLRVPDHWLPLQAFGTNTSANQAISSSQGLLVNYDAYSINTRHSNSYTALWLEQRYFSNRGYLSNTGTFRKNWRGESSSEGYLRYDTTWRYSDIDRMVSYQLGDVVSDSLSWSNSVRLGGLRVSRNFSIRPDLVTYPLLTINGTAAVPSSVDLFINGYKTSNNSVNAGPWTLTNTPYINGSGEATVVTTDALGRQVESTIPFYVANQLLSPGLSDYDFSAGSLRSNYGSRNADYNAGAVSSFYRYGLTHSLTIAMQGEARQGLVKGGVGLDIAPWRLGTLSLSASQSEAQQSGQQFTVGYSWVSSLFNLNLSHTQRTQDYSDLSVYDSSATLSRHAEQATLSFAPLGQRLGSIGIGYFDITAHDNTRTRLANLSWSKSLWGNSSLNLSLNKTLGDSGVAGQLQLLIPLANDSSLAFAQRRETDNHATQTLTYSHSTPTEGGLGWNLAASTTSRGYRQADLAWKNNYALLSGGVYGSSTSHSQWAEMSGSLVWMDNDLFASSKINDAFIVVSTNGFKDIPVNYENRYLGKTNSHGHLLVPYVSAWYPAKLSIDPLTLPPNMFLPSIERHVAVREGSGALVTFAMHKTHPLLLTLVDQHNQPLPQGIAVQELNSGQTAMIGYGGQAWFDDLPVTSRITVLSPDHSCTTVIHNHDRDNNLQAEKITCAIQVPRQEHTP
ncbi:fimbria/pilus outer membrane usher protein [Tatumella ptyseos]|uniref:fimbria/pilus outer membrane usher protein n=1 Tax=Tatumella ptyseos TaxID=82987 RepID=UPI0026F2E280|nr:fimbria/pilus outer membrane usher protein [Tatumella ptyseos]WKX27176.1 fimbria/pilus outer membrane usher protein [Tatumella ptyseos]